MNEMAISSDKELRKEITDLFEAMRCDKHMGMIDTEFFVESVMTVFVRALHEAETGWRIAGMKQARDRVLRRTEVPKDASAAGASSVD